MIGILSTWALMRSSLPRMNYVKFKIVFSTPKKMVTDWVKQWFRNKKDSKSSKIDIITADKLVFPCGMSRSGTTLLTTILDSHSKICMSYELIPPQITSLADLLRYLKHGLELSQGDFSTCGKRLREAGFQQEGLFFLRCYRAGIDADDTATILEGLLKKQSGVQTIRERYELAWIVSRRSATKKSKLIYGFKMNAPSFRQALEFFPNCSMIYIMRDPRDVVASHFSRNFDRTIEDICHAWKNYLTSFERVMNSNPDTSLMIRYEDLVSVPNDIIPKIINQLSIEMEDNLFEFYRSKAGIHAFGHPNADNLKKNFFTTSIKRWEKDLRIDQIKQIEGLCKDKLLKYGYRLQQ